MDALPPLYFRTSKDMTVYLLSQKSLSRILPLVQMSYQATSRSISTSMAIFYLLCAFLARFAVEELFVENG